MSTSFSVLLAFLALLACHGHEAAVLERSIFLKESIRLLGEILSTQVGAVGAGGRDGGRAGHEEEGAEPRQSCQSRPWLSAVSRGMGRARLRVSGWLRGGDISSLIAPLLSVLIKVSCDKANVTNVFAGNEVRRERRLESCDSAIGGGGRGSPRGLKPSRAHAGRAWGRDVPVLPAPARHRGGGTRPPPSACPPRALPQSMGTKRWRWHRSPSAWPSWKAGEQQAGMRVLQQHMGFFLKKKLFLEVFRKEERKCSLSLEPCVTLSQTPTHPSHAASRALV